MGKTRPFVADIMDHDALRRGFAGRAHNSELVIFNGDSNPGMLEMVLSSVLKFQELGIANWIMVTSAERDCAAAQMRTTAPLADGSRARSCALQQMPNFTLCWPGLTAALSGHAIAALESRATPMCQVIAAH